jgi:hypothetical protein
MSPDRQDATLEHAATANDGEEVPAREKSWMHLANIGCADSGIKTQAQSGLAGT